MVWGHAIHISTKIHIYFLTRLPFRGSKLVAQPRILIGVSVGVLGNCYCSGIVVMSNGLVSIVVIYSLEM
jgi:hypothetical protein